MNLHINNRFGVQKIHLRNDFSGWQISRCDEGEILIKVSVKSFPLKSDDYKWYLRVVGVAESDKTVVDSEHKDLVVGGDKTRDTIIPVDWKISGQCEVTPC